MGRKKIEEGSEIVDPGIPLVDSRHESFSQLMTKGDDLGGAYIDAGFKIKDKHSGKLEIPFTA